MNKTLHVWIAMTKSQRALRQSRWLMTVTSFGIITVSIPKPLNRRMRR